MFHMHPVVAAMLIDRQREIERNIRIRRMLEADDVEDQQPAEPALGTAGMPAVRPIAPRPSGPACEAL